MGFVQCDVVIEPLFAAADFSILFLYDVVSYFKLAIIYEDPVSIKIPVEANWAGICRRLHS